ncbi:protein of unknown function [Candidatus Filomicrobium marinum]|uniref:Uncharacterized protein n=1 Tax=Candidatus Filomicrobium marinum TaxID=1608628 RepID=A0A0D6JAQ3_9HYPH|nr:protein of unknown function [Candidatus Filomicrobium marinum]CPR15873.1 protein of unknown function [Candidatus Filomicrobium marinum]
MPLVEPLVHRVHYAMSNWGCALGNGLGICKIDEDGGPDEMANFRVGNVRGRFLAGSATYRYLCL